MGGTGGWDGGDGPVRYAERGSWRPLWTVLAALAVGFGLDAALPGSGPHYLGWVAALVLVGGTAALTVRARHRLTTVLLTHDTLQVGAERLALSTVDTAALRAPAAGPPLAARVLGGALSVPRGCQPLPLRLSDGATVVVPCRDPQALHAALLAQLDR